MQCVVAATPTLADMGKTAEPLKSQGGSKAESHIITGIEHYGIRHWGVAKNHFVEAEKADPQSAEAHDHLALVLDKRGDHADSAAHFNRAGAGEEQRRYSKLRDSEEACEDVRCPARDGCRWRSCHFRRLPAEADGEQFLQQILVGVARSLGRIREVFVVGDLWIGIRLKDVDVPL